MFCSVLYGQDQSSIKGLKDYDHLKGNNHLYVINLIVCTRKSIQGILAIKTTNRKMVLILNWSL